MSDMSWSPPAGPPNDAPIRASDARHEVEQAIETAKARDRELRAALVDAVAARSRAAARIPVVTADAERARSLAKRALSESDEAAHAGNDGDAAKWTAAAKVFAVRVRDGGERVASLERELADADERRTRLQRAIIENVGWLQAVATARLPMLGARRAGRLQRAVGETVSALTAPTGDLVARTVEVVRAEVDEAAENAVPEDAAGDNEGAVDAGDTGGAAAGAPAAALEDLEREVDIDRADDILDELRTELGQSGPTGDASSDDRVPAARP